MESIPNNSDAARSEKKQVAPVVPPGKAKLRKKSNLQKMTESFIEEDAQSIGAYVFTEVVAKKVKELLHDAGTSALDMLFYGSVQPHSGYPRGGASPRPGYPRYGATYNTFYASDVKSQAPKPKTRDEAFAYDDIVFETRVEAERVVDRMMDILNGYPSASIADLYEAAGVDVSSNYTLNNYGWTDLTGVETIPVRDGYIIKMPRPRVLATR